MGVVSLLALVRNGAAKLGPAALCNPLQPLLIVRILMTDDDSVGTFGVG